MEMSIESRRQIQPSMFQGNPISDRANQVLAVYYLHMTFKRDNSIYGSSFEAPLEKWGGEKALACKFLLWFSQSNCKKRSIGCMTRTFTDNLFWSSRSRCLSIFSASMSSRADPGPNIRAPTSSPVEISIRNDFKCHVQNQLLAYIISTWFLLPR